jgi:hypothetical protein
MTPCHLPLHFHLRALVFGCVSLQPQNTTRKDDSRLLYMLLNRLILCVSLIFFLCQSGHNVQQEDPRAVANALTDLLNESHADGSSRWVF